MPVFDSGAYLAQTLESVFAQTHERIEVVAADGGSTDDTIEILERYAAEQPGQVTVLRGAAGSGVCERRQMALEASSGELIAWLDSDDLWHPEKTAKQIALLEANPDVDVAFSFFDAFDSDTGESIPWPEGSREVAGDMLSRLFVEGCFIGALTALIRRRSLDERGLRLRTVEFSYGDDYKLWLSLLASGGTFAQVPEVLARYRRHGSNQSSTDESANSERSRARLLEEFLGEYPEAAGRLGSARAAGLSFAYGRAARFAVDRGHRAEAAKLLALSARHSPRDFPAASSPAPGRGRRHRRPPRSPPRPQRRSTPRCPLPSPPTPPSPCSATGTAAWSRAPSSTTPAFRWPNSPRTYGSTSSCCGSRGPTP